MTGFARIDGHLTVDGVRLETIAEQFGTPVYVYSAAAILDAYQKFAETVAGEKIYFALKANSNMAILRLLARAGAGADIVSGGELTRALEAGFAPQKIIFSGVGKTEAEIRDALQCDIGQINAESADEVVQILNIAQEIGRIARIALRINPDIDAPTHKKIATGKSDTKFGIAIAECAELYRLITGHANAEGAGLAVHIGSQIMNLEPFEQAWGAVLTLAKNLRTQGMDVPSLDLGGGMGVDYRTGETIDLDGFGGLVKRLFASHDFALGFEPGRFIVAEAGLLLSRVIAIKEGQEKTFIITDGAMNDFLRPTLYEAYHRIEPVGIPSKEEMLCDIVGPICETGDYFALGRMMPRVAAGDLLAVMAAGAYGAVMRSAYNSRPPASEVMVLEEATYLISKRQNIDDLISLDLIPQALL